MSPRAFQPRSKSIQFYLINIYWYYQANEGILFTRNIQLHKRYDITDVRFFSIFIEVLRCGTRVLQVIDRYSTDRSGSRRSPNIRPVILRQAQK